MKTNIVNETKKPIALKNLTNFVSRVCRQLIRQKVRNHKILLQKKELTVVFLNAKQMKKINAQFRGKDKATDILSFQSGDENCLGELLLCMDVLKKQAKQQKHSIQKESEYMLIHGILHLLGYDHEQSEKEEKLMFSIQDKCFKLIV